MRICVAHETVYRYETPSSGVIQTLRLTPRNHTGQYVVDWRIDVSADCRLEPQEDAFGNLTHAFSASGPISDLRLMVEGEVETQDTAGRRARRGGAVSAEPVPARDPADPAPTRRSPPTPRSSSIRTAARSTCCTAC